MRNLRKIKRGFQKIEDKFRDMMNKATEEEHDEIVKGLNTLKRLIESNKQ
jgi:hypothetical protein